MAKLTDILNEDLRKWFGKGKTGSSDGGGWDRYGSDGQKLGKCGDGDGGDAYAACLSKEKAAKLGPDKRASFVKRKRAAQKDAGDAKKGGEQSKGQKPTLVKTKANEMKENISTKLKDLLNLREENEPTNPALWSKAIAAAKAKYDVYPSAYANGYASKWYKKRGGDWKTKKD